MIDLSGQVAIVTGAGGGLGRSHAHLLAARGAHILVNDLGEGAETVAAEIRHKGGSAIAFQGSVTDADAMQSMADTAMAQWGRIDILVNNAGHDIGGRRQFHEGTANQWAATIETNVIGLMRVTRVVIDRMVERNTGHIVNIGSVAGIQAYKACAAYAASKHAVHGLSETLRLDYSATGIKISEVLPGMVETEFAATRFGDEKRGEEYYRDFGVCLMPEDIARSVRFVLEQPNDVVITQIVVVPTRRTPDSSAA